MACGVSLALPKPPARCPPDYGVGRPKPHHVVSLPYLNNYRQVEGTNLQTPLKENTMSPASNHDQSISVAFESIRDFNVKMIDMAHANMDAFFGLARQLATAKAPSDIVELCTAHARKQ